MIYTEESITCDIRERVSRLLTSLFVSFRLVRNFSEAHLWNNAPAFGTPS
jgi:hypothetical protein